jgi:Uma2 family endonuclease
MTTLAPPLAPVSFPARSPAPVIYPESDGQPMADNTLQFQWIVAIHSGLNALFKDDPTVFVAGDLLWYPVEGDNKTRVAPDVLVAFGRPKGYRGSYLQWVEGGLAPQVVFEILSPGNTLTEMAKKLRFYERFGVEEYYLYDPDAGDLSGWQRKDNRLEVIEDIHGWVSPRLRVKFTLEQGELALYGPDGWRFETYNEVLERAEDLQTKLETEARRAESEARRAESEARRAERLAEKLRALGLDPDAA